MYACRKISYRKKIPRCVGPPTSFRMLLCALLGALALVGAERRSEMPSMALQPDNPENASASASGNVVRTEKKGK